MTAYQNPIARDLPCIFMGLVKNYSKIGLKTCETKESQVWRHASNRKTAKRLASYHDYLPELINFHSSLESYSICERHYNQTIAKKQFYQSLTERSEANFIEQTETAFTVSDARYPSLRRRTSFRREQSPDQRSHSVQKKDNSIDCHYSDPMIEIEKTKSLLELSQLENQRNLQLITDLNNQIARMQQHMEYQRNEIEELKQKLQRAYDYAAEFRNLYEEQYKKNDILIEQWDLRFDNQQKRIDAITEIANIERGALFNDIELLIRDNNRFSIENLMVYTPREWLNKRNRIIVKFVETMVQNNQDTDNLSQEKVFKTAVAVDAIYGAWHKKYVSEVHLAASAIKYSIARSKTIIGIDDHITNSGSYT